MLITGYADAEAGNRCPEPEGDSKIGWIMESLLF